MSAPGLIAAISGTRQRKKAQRALNRELANAPKYDIADEVFENQATARSTAYGRDRALQMGAEDIEQGVSNAASQARSVSSSTSALMGTIAQIQANRNQQLRGLAQDDAVLRNQKLQNLQAVNNQVVDEKDKAWNYNVNMPFQMRVASYRDRIKAGSEMEMADVAAQAQTESALISSVGSIVGGVAGCDERIKENVKEFHDGLDMVMQLEPVTFDYIPESRFHDGKNHIGFIAQKVDKVVPQAVSRIHDGTDVLMVDFKELVGVLVNAVQDQQKQIDSLKMQVKMLKGEFIES